MKSLNVFFGRLCYFFLGTSLLAVTFVLCANVVLRYVFHASLSWGEEFARYAVAWITFIGISACVVKNMDINIDSLLMLLTPSAKKVVSIAAVIVSMIFLAVLLRMSIALTFKAYSTNQYTTAMNIPMYWVYLSMPVGAALTLATLAAKLFALIKMEVNK